MGLGALSEKPVRAAVFWLLAMSLIHAIIVYQTLPLLRRGYQDFTIFYTAGRILQGGQTGSLYDLKAQYKLQQDFASFVAIRKGPLPYNHPPFEALLFLPLAYLPFWSAYLLWTAL